MYRFLKMLPPLGLTGVVLLGALQLVPSPKPLYHTCLTHRENEQLGLIPELRTFIDRLSLYEPLDPGTFEKILKWALRVAVLSSAPHTNASARRVDSIMVQLKKLVSRMGPRVGDSPEAHTEFTDLSDDFCDACDSYSFNVHTELSNSCS
jgi:hypothetical protein